MNWLFPHKCIACSGEVDEQSTLCARCFTEITFIDYPICRVCGRMFESQESYDQDEVCDNCAKTQPHFDMARSLMQHNSCSRRVVMRIKKATDYSVVKICAERIHMRYPRLFDNIDYSVPVPSHWTRLIRRGNNPPDIIALKLADVSGIEYRRLLKRVRRTEYQKDKSAAERRINIEGAFVCSCDNSVIVGKNVLVVDDVMTTGITLNECAKVLKAAGAVTVNCATITSTRQSYRGAK
ncbi:MAG: ComF family protein [Holosporales bacterium]|jgi:ComF family protein|nr:ComF family protein [Holosporales bacterium]